MKKTIPALLASTILISGCSPGDPPPAATTATAAKIPLAGMPKIDAAPLLEHIKTLSSDTVRGPTPGTPGEERTVEYLDGRVPEAGTQAGQHRRHLHPEGAARRHHRHRGQAAGGVGQGPRDLQVARRGRRLDQARRRRRQHRELRPRLRRLRRRRARVQLGRLQGRRSQGQDAGRARQRSAGAGCRRPVEARRPDVQRHRDDLLRPVDLQVRGSGATRRGRRPHRPRDRAGRLSRLRSCRATSARSSTW